MHRFPATLAKILLTALLLTALLPTALAASFEDINQPEVFLKQENNGTCTLASSAMMLRRAAILRGDANWAESTEQSNRDTYWRAGRGLPYVFSYNGFTVGHAFLPGGEENRQILIDLLAQHPEGIVLHASCVPHGILLTDYTDGVFYCADPSQAIAYGRIPIGEAYGTRIENSNAYWFVSDSALRLDSPLETLCSNLSQQTATPAVSTAPLALASGGVQPLPLDTF